MEPPTSAPGGQPCEGSCKPPQGSGFALLAIVVSCLALAAGLAYWKFDWRVAAFFLHARIPIKAPRLLVIGDLGRPLAPFWLFLLWAWAAKRPRVLLAGLLAMLLTMCAVLPIKSVVGRVRPDEEPAEVMNQPFFHRSYSFPSGDATLAFAVATVAAGFIPAANVRWLPFLLAAMACVTRLMLLRHFASDVIAGAALGILCGYAALRISRSQRSRKMLSRVPPTCWRPAFGAATLLFLIFDAVARGPLTKNFLPIFWPGLAFVLIATKGPAWLSWMDSRKSAWKRIAGLLGVAGIIMPASSLIYAVCCMDVMTEKWIWFLPGAVMSLIGVFWASRWRLRRGRGAPTRPISRMTAASVLSIGLSLEALRAAVNVLGP
jgi:membrane-associated phospholipid phosphatase